MYKLLLKSTFIISISFMPYYAFSQDSSGIEEVVVTAEKREQNLQDVPSSITAISDTEIERATYQNMFDLQTSVPSLVVGSAGASRPFLFIRGVGSRKFDPGTEGAVGVFVDEIYNTRFTNSMMDIVDLERVEVLKAHKEPFMEEILLVVQFLYILKNQHKRLRVKLKLVLVMKVIVN